MATLPYTTDFRLNTENGQIILLWSDNIGGWALERETDSFEGGLDGGGLGIYFVYFPDKNDPDTYDLMRYTRNGAGPRYTFSLNDALRANVDAPGATPFFVTTGWDLGPASAGDGVLHGIGSLGPIRFDGLLYSFDTSSSGVFTNYLSPEFEGVYLDPDSGNPKPFPFIVAQEQRQVDLTGSIPNEAIAYLDHFTDFTDTHDEAWVLQDDVWVPYAFNGPFGGVAGGTNHTFSFPNTSDVPPYGSEDVLDQAELTREKGFTAEAGFRPRYGFRRRYGFTAANGF